MTQRNQGLFDLKRNLYTQLLLDPFVQVEIHEEAQRDEKTMLLPGTVM